MYAVTVAVTTALFAFTPGINLSLEIGGPLPKADLKLKDISGKEIAMKEMMKANGLLVMFSCNTCPYVMRNQSRTNEICTYALQHNIGVILLKIPMKATATTEILLKQCRHMQKNKVIIGLMQWRRTMNLQMLLVLTELRNTSTTFKTSD